MRLNKQFLIDSLVWGSVLWVFGYGLGIAFFSIVPKDKIGWFVMPLGVAATLWVLLTRIKARELSYYLVLGIVWTVLAIVFDYIFLVKAFNVTDYYKPDVYLYYLLTFALPTLVGWYKFSRSDTSKQTR